MMARARLDKTGVVQAAADLVNAEGLAALTLGRLADILGIRTPSLYNHIDGMPGLQRELALLATHQLGECLAEAVMGRSGAEALAALAHAYRAYVHANPGLYATSVPAAGLLPPDPELSAAQERILQVCLAALTAYHLSQAEAIHTLRGLRSLAHGFATLEIAGGFGLPVDCEESYSRLVEMYIRGVAVNLPE